MKSVLFTESTSRQGRSGVVGSTDDSFQVQLRNPLAEVDLRGPTRETLLGCAYAACFHGALMNAATRLAVPVEEATVTARVDLQEDEAGFWLAVVLEVDLRDTGEITKWRLMEEAHRTCPYSRALRGKCCVTLVSTRTGRGGSAMQPNGTHIPKAT